MELSIDLVDDDMFEPLARLLECVKFELAEANTPSLCFCGFWPGTQQPPFGFLDCDRGNCGVAWLSLTAEYPSESFPLPTDGTRGSRVKALCAAPMAYQFEVGIARCAPRATGTQVLPDEQDMFDAQRLYMADARAVRRAIACCFPAANSEAQAAVPQAERKAYRFELGDWRPIENFAGASGGIWKAWIGKQ